MANKNNKIKPYQLLIPVITVLVTFLGSQLTNVGLKDWYFLIEKPAWTPPGSTIGMVWTVIFILTALSAFIVYSKKPKNIRAITTLFMINAGLNIFWSALFFVFHALQIATIEAGVLALSVVALIINIWPVSKVASLLLIPYAAWVSFATYLTYMVSSINP